MSAFIKNDITDGGLNALAHAMLGEELRFTKIVVGSGYMPAGATPRSMEAVVTPVATLDIVKLKQGTEQGIVIAGGIFTNKDIAVTFPYRELALYAETDSTGEVLYCYGNAEDAAELIPPGTSSDVVEKVVDIVTTVSGAANVTATISSEAYVSVRQLEDEIANIKIDANADAITISQEAQTTTGAVEANADSALISIGNKITRNNFITDDFSMTYEADDDSYWFAFAKIPGIKGVLDECGTLILGLDLNTLSADVKLFSYHCSVEVKTNSSGEITNRIFSYDLYSNTAKAYANKMSRNNFSTYVNGAGELILQAKLYTKTIPHKATHLRVFTTDILPASFMERDLVFPVDATAYDKTAKSVGTCKALLSTDMVVNNLSISPSDEIVAALDAKAGYVLNNKIRDLQTALPSPTSSGTILYSIGEGVRRNIPFLIGEPKPVKGLAVEKLEGGWPTDLISYMDFSNGLVPAVGDFTLTSSGDGISVTDGYWGNGIHIDGTTSDYAIASTPVLPLGSPFTLRLKCKTTSSATNVYVCGTSWADAQKGSYLAIHSGKIFYNCNNSGEYSEILGPLINDNEWHDIIASYSASTSGSGMVLWIDGEKVGEKAIPAPPTSFERNFCIGCVPGTTGKSLDCTIDEIEVYGKVKTPLDFKKDQLGIWSKIQMNPSVAKLTWINPTDLLIPQTVHIRRGSEAYPATLEEGVEVYSGSDESCLDESAELSTDQYYTAWVDNSMVQKTDESMRVKYSYGVDYLMLYDHGDECADVTGGWCDASSTSRITIAGVKTTKAIDLSIHNKILIKWINGGNDTKYGLVKIGSGDVSYLSNFITLSGSSGVTIADTKGINSNQIYICAEEGGPIGTSIVTRNSDHIFCQANNPTGSTRSICMYNMTLFKTDDYTPWLRAGNLNPSNYPTLNSLLADETAMGVLMNSSAAVDRMIRYTGTVMAGVINSETAMTALGLSPYVTRVMQNPDWGKFLAMSPYLSVWDGQANTKKVPVMTGYTTPSGEVLHSASQETYYAWKAFDNKLSTEWYTATPSSRYIGYQFPAPVTIYKITIRPRQTTSGNWYKQSFKSSAIQGFNGERWIDVWKGIIREPTGIGDVIEVLLPLGKPMKAWRVFTDDISHYGNDSFGVSELQFYGK